MGGGQPDFLAQLSLRAFEDIFALFHTARRQLPAIIIGGIPPLSDKVSEPLVVDRKNACADVLETHDPIGSLASGGTANGSVLYDEPPIFIRRSARQSGPRVLGCVHLATHDVTFGLAPWK
jgi:hypothetical protein